MKKDLFRTAFAALAATALISPAADSAKPAASSWEQYAPILTQQSFPIAAGVCNGINVQGLCPLPLAVYGRNAPFDVPLILV
ncbi:MAG: hypothetical protein P4M15_07635 [Alphaproteobacteria bacterium]|nr:hypothetical protein [Alphaproteobacteria bacterium]